MNIEKFLEIVGNEGVVPTATKFVIKSLTQSWQTLFKILNRYTTTRMSGLDQTKIHTLQMFHAMVNNHNIDYARLILNDLVYEVNKFSKADDDPILMMFTTGNPLIVTVMRILDEFLMEVIKKTEAYKDYDDYKGVVIPRTQSSPIVSTQRTHGALSTPRTSKPKRTPQKKREKVVGGINQEDPNTRLEPKSHKESLKEKNDDDDDDNDDDQHNFDALIRKKKKGSLEIKEEEKQTSIPTPPRSPRTNLSSDKELLN
ncbi:hypothetical protein Tco_1048031 [Tanacetum coccineum]